MKNQGKDKAATTTTTTVTSKDLEDQNQEKGNPTTSIVALNGQDPHEDSAIELLSSAIHQQQSKLEGGAVSDMLVEDVGEDAADQDQEMKEVSPAAAEVQEQHDTPMTEPTPLPENTGTIVGQGIDQDDLDGGLLDGALDDYDDLDQDTEDTEVGDGTHDFSDDDDDDDDDLDDLDEHRKAGPNGDMNRTGGMSHAATARSRDQDADMLENDNNQRDKGSVPVHSEDSDSDLPDPEGSDNDHDDEDEGEGDADEDDAGDEEDEEDEDEDDDELHTKQPVAKKDTPHSQKPILNRPSVLEELKDSGDDLSDLSEFEDSDDSDEDDDMDKTEVTQKEPSSVNPSSTAGSTAAVGTTKSAPGGRKRSVHDAGKDSARVDQEVLKTEKKKEEEVNMSNGRARLSEPASRNRKASASEDAHNSDKESGSEPPEEEEEDEEEDEDERERRAVKKEDETKVAQERVGEEEEAEEEDHETKQMHKDALEALTSIEVEFASLRDKMYEERMTELDREVDMINNGTHPELSSLMQEIEQKRDHRLRIAEMGKKHLTEIAQNKYIVAEYQAHCTFQSARRTARSDMVRALGKKQQQMIMDLALSSDTHKRKVTADKASLLRARKQRRMEVNELRAANERLGFPTSTKVTSVTTTELDSDFAAMGLARPTASVNSSVYEHHSLRTSGHEPLSTHSRSSSITSRPMSSNRWPNSADYPPPSNMVSSGNYYGSRPEVEIYVDGSRCMIDGIWYKPNDSVVVLDAALGKYNAKYLFLVNDEIMLQRTDGSKTRLHLSQFRGRKLCMQPKP
ncbi:Transcriptional regulatory protein [Haplosporangium sp. Z 767]|nr:Transcriptional regulatory protein [Haplosporangium sp. Z 767]